MHDTSSSLQLGGVGQRRLKASSIAVIGAGGIGSAAIPALAGAGIGQITIVDDDLVDRSNLQRQPLFRDDQVGQSKAMLAAAFARSLNPSIAVEGVEARIEGANAEKLLAGHDLVLDGSDNFATRLIVSRSLRPRSKYRSFRPPPASSRARSGCSAAGRRS